MASGLEWILGPTSRNSTKSVRKSDWSAMLENVEKTLWILLLVPAIAPARNCSEPHVSAPVTVRYITYA